MLLLLLSDNTWIRGQPKTKVTASGDALLPWWASLLRRNLFTSSCSLLGLNHKRFHGSGEIWTDTGKIDGAVEVNGYFGRTIAGAFRKQTLKWKGAEFMSRWRFSCCCCALESYWLTTSGFGLKLRRMWVNKRKRTLVICIWTTLQHWELRLNLNK